GRNMTMPAVLSGQSPDLSSGSVTAGEVDVETVVSAAGTVTHMRVSRSTDQTGVLDRALVEELRNWRFQPAKNSSGPMASLVLMRFAVTKPSSGAPNVDARVATVDYVPGPERWTPPAGGGVGASGPPSMPGNGVQWPSVIREIKPSYTPDAMRAKVMGQVELEVIVASDGTVAAARVTKSLDSTYGLDRAALVAARYWFFKPGMRNGVAVPTTVGLVLEFRLH